MSTKSLLLSSVMRLFEMMHQVLFVSVKFSTFDAFEFWNASVWNKVSLKSGWVRKPFATNLTYVRIYSQMQLSHMPLICKFFGKHFVAFGTMIHFNCSFFVIEGWSSFGLRTLYMSFCENSPETLLLLYHGSDLCVLMSYRLPTNLKREVYQLIDTWINFLN